MGYDRQILGTEQQRGRLKGPWNKVPPVVSYNLVHDLDQLFHMF